jgi:hypothetical protein
MKSTENWWRAEVDWQTPAGELLQKLLAALPADRPFHITLYGSAPLQLTVDRTLLSGDVDLFSVGEEIDLIIDEHGLGKNHHGLHLETGFELSFRTSPRWRLRAKDFQFKNVTLTLPHPLDILIGKLDRLAPKDLEAFKRVINITGHPTAEELKQELQNAVDLFSPGFDESSPNRLPENTERLWREIFKSEINIRREIIAPALALRKKGYGEPSPEYKNSLRD